MVLSDVQLRNNLSESLPTRSGNRRKIQDVRSKGQSAFGIFCERDKKYWVLKW